MLLASVFPGKQLFSQSTAYIYVHQSTIDENSNPASGGFGYTVATNTAGASVVPGFTLNDLPTTVFANNTFGTSSTDVGAASTGTLFAATPGGVYYRTTGNSTWNLAAGTTAGATRVDGGILDMAVYANNNGAYLAIPALSAVTTLVAASGIRDVAFDRKNNIVLYIDNNYKIFYASVTSTIVGSVLTGATVGVFKQVTGSNIARRIDVDASGNLFYLGGVNGGNTDNNFYKLANYNTTNTQTKTSFGQPNNAAGTAYDLAAADDGSYYAACTTNSTFGVFKWAGGTSWTNEPQSGVTFNITGGPAGQVWSTYYSNNIWTRLPGTTPNWLDDERVRTTTALPGNSEMIAVTIPAGSTTATYVVTQTPGTPNTTWNLQKISIYDSGTTNTQTSSVSNSTATITVSAGEVVHVVYQDYYNSVTAFTNDCSATGSSFTENFGNGTSGTLGNIAPTAGNTTSPETGTTSYHWYGTATGSIPDGYYGVCTNSNDVGYGTNNNLPKTYDHTTGNGTGNYLFFNASFQKDVFYQQEFTNLIPGNPYTITYWIVNITGNKTAGDSSTLHPINVTAQVTDPNSGNVIGTATSGDIYKVGVWLKQTFTFTPGPSQTSANLVLINGAPGGNGNDLGLDDISFKLQPAAATVAVVANTCSGTSTLTVTSPVGSVNGKSIYQYSISGVNGGAWQSSPVFSGLVQNSAYNVYSSYVGSTNCASSATVVPVNMGYKWSGLGAAGSLTDAANWVGGVAPNLNDESTSVEIPVVTNGNYPVLTADESLFNLQIDGAPAKLSLNGFTLNVGCDIYNSTTGGVNPGTYPTGGIINSGADLTKSTINWNGSTADQKYVGNLVAGTAKINNMSVNNTYVSNAGVPGMVTISSGPVDIYNLVTMQSGNLAVSTATNTLFTLKSSQTNTASVAQIKAAANTPTISGNVNVERYLSGGAQGSGYRGYRLLSSPVWTYPSTVSPSVNCYPLAYVNANISGNPGALTGGVGTGSNPNSNGFTITNPAGNPTLYLYDESRMSNIKDFVSGKNIGISKITDSYVNITGSSAPIQIPVGNGYIFYFIGDNTNLNPASGRYIQPTIITATGKLNLGIIKVHLWNNVSSTSLSYTPNTGNSTIGAGSGSGVWGLNQVGNPYASTIDLETLYADNHTGSGSDIGSAFYELKEPFQNYIAYTAGQGGLTSSTYASKYIASGQGFLVSAASSSSTLTFTEDVKDATQLVPTINNNAGSPALLLSVKHPDNGSKLSGLHLELKKDSITATQTGIYFAADGSDTYNPLVDAIDLGGISPQLYLSSLKAGGQRVGINELGDYTKGKRVKLFVQSAASGTYQLGLANIINIDTLYNVYLVDNLLKDSVELRKVKTYSFAINTADTTTFGTERFVLAVEIKQLPPYKLLSFTGQKVNTTIQLAWKTLNESNYTGFTLEKLSGSQYTPLYDIQSNNSAVYTFTDTHPVIGVNTYRLKQDGVIGDITYSQLINIDYNTFAPNQAISVYPNPARANISVAVNQSSDTYKMNIYNSMGASVKQQSVTGTYWTENIDKYLPGTYIVELYDSKGKFVGKTKFVKLQ